MLSVLTEEYTTNEEVIMDKTKNKKILNSRF